jgi:hypothetical protein
MSTVTKDLAEIEARIRKMLLGAGKATQVGKDTAETLEIKGTKTVPYGKGTVDGYYFATMIVKPKDIRFYFFPIYTHKEHFDWVPESVLKMLKGKSCFYIKSLDDESENANKKND